MAAQVVTGLNAPKAAGSRSEPHASPSLGAMLAPPLGLSAALVLAGLDAEAPDEACFRFDAVYSLPSRAIASTGRGLGAARPQALLKRSLCIGGPVEPWMDANSPRPAPLGPFTSPAWPVVHTAALPPLPAAPTKGRRGAGRRAVAAGGVGVLGAKTPESQDLGRGKRRAAQRQALTVVALLEGPEEALPAATPKAALVAAEILAGLRAREGGGHVAPSAVPPALVAAEILAGLRAREGGGHGAPSAVPPAPVYGLPPSVAVADAALGFETPNKGAKRRRTGSRSVSPDQSPDGVAVGVSARVQQKPKERQKNAITVPFALVSPLVQGPKAPLLTA